MNCSRAAQWLQLYIDGRLEAKRLAPLESHLQQCPRCARDLAQLERMRGALVATVATPEPPDLERTIRARIAAYEASRIALAAARQADQAERAAWRERRWQVAAIATILALTYFLLPTSAHASLGTTLNRGLPGIVQALTSPGPDSVAWAAWVAGAMVVLLLTVYLMRADASAGLRRSIADRWPQLW